MKAFVLILIAIVAVLFVKTKLGNKDATEMWEDALTLKEDKSITEGRESRKIELAKLAEKPLNKGVNRIIVQSDLSYPATVFTRSKSGFSKSLKIGSQEISAFDVPDGEYYQYFTLEKDPKTRHPISMAPNNPLKNTILYG